jgi:Tol biopolymer transport system component
VYDLERDTLTRLTSDGDANRYPAWTPDGLRLAYHFQGKGASAGLFWTRADGSGEPQRLTHSENQQIPSTWHPDGKILAFHETFRGGSNVVTLSVEGAETSGWKPADPRRFLPGWRPAFSPDGRWLAYTSAESGNHEVYVQRFPDKGGKQQISDGGGMIPKWAREGNELFYRTPDNTIKAVKYTTAADGFRAERPRLWSPGRFANTGSGDAGNFDLHPDAKRFAVLMPPRRVEAAKLDKVTFIFNFFAEVRRRTGK